MPPPPAAPRRLQALTLPRHIVLLNGPPGCGKGANTPACKSALGINYNLEMSALLRADPEAQQVMANGGLVSDARSCVALLHALVDPARSCPHGVIVDGFPRSAFQVRDKQQRRGWPVSRAQRLYRCGCLATSELCGLRALRHVYARPHDGATIAQVSFVQSLQARLQRMTWPTPTHFTSVLLSVSEATSLNRQLQRFETALWSEVFGEGARDGKTDRQKSCALAHPPGTCDAWLACALACCTAWSERSHAVGWARTQRGVQGHPPHRR